MDDVQVRRLVVPDSDKRMCGIVSLADAARGSLNLTGDSLKRVARLRQPYGSEHGPEGLKAFVNIRSIRIG